MAEEPLDVTQERARGFNAPKLLEECEGQNLRVREPLQGLLATAAGIKEAVGVAGETEEHGHGLFRAGEAWDKVGGAICRSLWWGVGWPLFYSQTAQY